MNKIIKNTLILTMITAISGLALGTVYEITKEPIRLSEEKAKEEACKVALPEAEQFAEVKVEGHPEVNEVYQASKDGNSIGYVITTTNKEGYGGDIKVSVGIRNDGTTDGISILTINETAGLGMKAKEPEFYEQYMNQDTDQFYVAKDGGEGTPIDAIGGATITSRAMTNAVNTALSYYKSVLEGGVNE